MPFPLRDRHHDVDARDKPEHELSVRQRRHPFGHPAQKLCGRIGAAHGQVPAAAALSGAMTTDADDARRTARILLEIEAIHIRPSQPFTFTSGWASPVYVDCRKVISFPRARRAIIDMAVAKIERAIGFEALDAVAGGETAGIP